MIQSSLFVIFFMKTICIASNDHIKPDLLLYGHYHKVEISNVGSDFDTLGQPCTAIVGSKPIFDKENGNSFIGCALSLMENGKKRVVFNDDKGAIHADAIID